MAQPQKAHPEHNQNEFIVAAITGFGLLLAATAAMFDAFGSRDDMLGLTLTAVFEIGMVFVVTGILVWLALLRPWEKFDDLKTPYYTGHHDHDEHEDEHAAPHISDAEAAVREVIAEVEQSPAEPAVATPPAVKKAAAEKIDDLELIEGIGRQAKAALVAAGMTTFQQIADSSASDLDAILDRAKLGSISADTWAKQAQFILGDDVQAFEEYQEKLRAGRKVDDLKRIEGIGPKVEAALVAAGMTTFAQLAGASSDDLYRIVKTEAGVRIVGDAGTWAKQAQYIVDGDIEGFEAYKGKLKGGREVG